MYNYNVSVDSSSAAVAGAAVGTMLATIIIVSLIVYVISVIAMWKLFTKAGKPGWASIVPIYNAVVLFQIAGLNPFLLLLALIPIVNVFAMIVLMILLNINLAKAFGKSTGFAVGLIFLNSIFMLILGLGDSQYVGLPENKA